MKPTKRFSRAAAVVTAVISAGLSLGFVATAGSAFADTSSASTMTITDSSTSVMGSTVTTAGIITVKDVVQNSGVERQTYTITAVDPDGNSTVIGSKDIDPNHQNTITGTLNTAAFPSTSTAEAMNGTYTFNSSGSGDSGQTTLQIAPSTVSGVTATASNSAFTVGWDAENYPDLTGYVISESDGRNLAVTPSEADCSSSASCSFSAAKGTDKVGTAYSFAVVAQRCQAPAASGATCTTLSSPTSATAPATLTAKTTSTSSNNGSGSNSGGSSTLPTVASSAGPKAVDGIGNNGFTKSGHLQAFVPGTGGNLPSADLPGLNLPSGALSLPGAEGSGSQALPQGTYKPQLPYSGKANASSSSTTASGQSVTTAFVNVFDNSSFWRALALASVLLLAGSHLLVWLRRVPLEI